MGPGDDEPDVELGEPFQELQKNRRSRRIEEGDGPGVEHHGVYRLPRRFDELQDVVTKPTAIGEEQRRVEPVHDDSRSCDDTVKTFDVSKRVIVGDVPEHRPMRQGGVVDECHQRDSHGDEQALEDTKGQDADERNDPITKSSCRICQARRNPEISKSPLTATITTAPRVAAGRFLKSGVKKSNVSPTATAATAPLSCVRAPASPRKLSGRSCHRPETPERARLPNWPPRSRKLSVGVYRITKSVCHGLGNGDRFDVTHQRNTQRTERQAAEVVDPDLGDLQGGQAARNRTGHGHAVGGQVEQAGGRDGQCDDNERRRPARCEPAQEHHGDD